MLTMHCRQAGGTRDNRNLKLCFRAYGSHLPRENRTLTYLYVAEASPISISCTVLHVLSVSRNAHDQDLLVVWKVDWEIYVQATRYAT